MKNGDVLEAGEALTEGPINPHDILKIKGVKGVQDYLLKEVQRGLPAPGRGDHR